MQLKTQTDYIIRILLYLAANSGLSSTQELSGQLGIKRSYLPKILNLMRKEGLILSETGVNGGYRIAKTPSSITLLELMKLSEDSVKINRCLEADRFCSRDAAGSCAVYDVYAAYQEMAEWYFGSITIADLLEPDAAGMIRTRGVRKLRKQIEIGRDGQEG